MIRERKGFLSAVTVALTGLTVAGCDDDPTRIVSPDEPKWTVMVYLAGDNSLAKTGLDNIDELEAAGVDPSVQVVVQAEFSQAELAKRGCDASCYNPPNFNAFRYAITSERDSVPGPNGPTTDIGNRDMTDPAELNEFVQWAQTNYPARRFLLILMDHASGYSGLVFDETSAPDQSMQLRELPDALAGADVDVLGFDMCLMAGYETLANITGQVPFTVFSEASIPGPGLPYTDIIGTLHADPAMDGRTAAESIADLYHAWYDGSDFEESTTISAYALEGFADFESALNSLAASLQSNLPELSPAITNAAAASQSFKDNDTPEMKDIVNFLDSLAVRIPDEDIQAQIDELRDAALDPDFRLRSHFRNSPQDTADFSRTTGLNIVLPSGVGKDRFQSEGTQSLAQYQEQMPGKPWTQFLTDFVEAHDPGVPSGETSACFPL